MIKGLGKQLGINILKTEKGREERDQQQHPTCFTLLLVFGSFKPSVMLEQSKSNSCVTGMSEIRKLV